MNTELGATAPPDRWSPDNAPTRLLDTIKAAELIDMSASWLEHDRQRLKPEIPYVRMGSRAVRYRVADLLAYAEDRLGKPMAA